MIVATHDASIIESYHKRTIYSQQGKGRRAVSATQKFIYASEDAYSNIKENFTATILSSMTVACTIAILAIFIIIFFNLRGAVEGWGESTHIIAYVKGRSFKLFTLKTLQADVKAVSGVKELSATSQRPRRFKNLSEELSEHSAIFEGVKKDILPASFEIKVTEEYRDPAEDQEGCKGY